MEYSGRHMIAVGSCDAENVLRARNEAAAVFGTCVSPFVAGNSDRYQAFSIGCARVMPGGCKDCSGARRKYQRWLRCAETDRLGAQIDWIEIEYNNKCESLAVIASSDPSNLTFDGVAVLAAILSLSTSHLLHDSCAVCAVCGTDDVDPKNSCMRDRLPFTPHDIQQFSSLHLQTNRDADLIRLCEWILDTEGQIADVYGPGKTIEDERRTNLECTVLSDKRRRIEDTLYDTAAPRTLEGAQAMARLALAIWPTACEEGKPAAHDFREWLSLSVIEFLADLKSDA